MTPDQTLQVEHHLETALLLNDSELETPNAPLILSTPSLARLLLSQPRLLLSLSLGLLRQLVVVLLAWLLVYLALLPIHLLLGR